MKTHAEDPPIKAGDPVRTRKGARFAGIVVVVYDSLKGIPHAVVEADHPYFDGTEHVYPLAQLVIDWARRDDF
jgi:hypothetical protein